MVVVVRTLPSPTETVWYLAYGSNLSSSKFINDRGIVPLSALVVTVPGWTLTMDSAGVPYSEPSFASISPICDMGNEKGVQLIGTAYELTPEMYTKAIASEGGGIAYAEVEVRAEVLALDENERSETSTETFAARSLVTVLRREARPSVRYMDLVRNGANDAHMPHKYQRFLARIPVYNPPTKPLHQIGAALFLAFWAPLMSMMEKVTKANLNPKTGNAPPWVITMVRTVVLAMWLYHDFVHAPIWGKGDGM